MGQQERTYSVILDPDEHGGGYTVTVPALPGVVTQGDTIEDAIRMAREAIQCHVEGLIADGAPVPEERDHPQIVTIRVAA